MSDCPDERDGGPAFPTCAEGGTNNGCQPVLEWGMSLRDYFAAQALAPLITSGMDTKNSDWPVTVAEIAQKAYQFADEMLQARKR